MKLRIIKNCWKRIFNSALKKHDSSRLAFEAGENVPLFEFISSLGAGIKSSISLMWWEIKIQTKLLVNQNLSKESHEKLSS